MYSIEEMRKMTIQQLTPLAKKFGIVRLHSMRKNELVERLYRRMKESQDSQNPLDFSKGARRRALESFSSELAPPSTDADASSENSSLSLNTSTPSDSSELANTAPANAALAAGSATDSASDDVLDDASDGTSNMDSQLKSKPETPISPQPATVRSAMPAAEPSIFNKQFQMVNLAYMPDVTEEDVEEESLDVTVMDPYWLHVIWTIRRRTIERAKAAMGQSWYEAKPILRVNVLRGGDAGTGGRYYHERDVLIHGRSNHWFVSISNPPRTYLIEIGYLSRQGFFCLLRGNVVSTPQIRGVLRYEKSTDVSWMTACDLRPAQIPDWSPSNHVLSRKWTSKASSLFSIEDGADGKTVHNTIADYPFRISTEMVIYGSTSPDSQVTANEEWVAVQPDGTFMLRVDVPEQGKQMLTLDSTNRRESQKIHLTLERTTQVQKPQKLGEKPAAK